MKKEFIVERQGKNFVLYAGLLDLCHQKGLISITTQLLQIPTEENKHVAIVQATVNLRDGEECRVFQGLGDAAPNNVAPGMQNCLIRLAETRAKARALRDAVNVGVTAFEELGEESFEEGPPPRSYSSRSQRSARMTSRAGSPTPIPAELKNPHVNPITEAQTKAVHSLCRPRKLDPNVIAREQYEVEDLMALTEAQAGELIRSLNTR